MFLINPYWYSATAIAPTDYIALYKFEDNGNDETGNHTATMSNVTYSDTGGVTGQGKYGIFNGTTSYGQVTDHADITDLKTVSCWIYRKSGSLGGNGRIFEKGSTMFWFNSNDVIVFQKDFSIYKSRWDTRNATLLTFDTWYHVAFTYPMDDNITTPPVFYINGVSVAVFKLTTADGIMVSDTGTDLLIGNTSTNDFSVDGRLENLRLYNRVLTPAEIQSIYDEENT